MMTTIMPTLVTRMDMAILTATDALTTVIAATIRPIARLMFTAVIRPIAGLITAVIALTIRGALTRITLEPPPIIGPTFEPAPIAGSGSFRQKISAAPAFAQIGVEVGPGGVNVGIGRDRDYRRDRVY